uniref:Fungal lipase-like domain-containing protein n=1 Tax=Panagrolaimus davidi TaxID=227884 RepID=A0A914QPB1_9BILA
MASLCFKKSYPNGDWELLNISFINPCTRFNIDLCQVLIAKSEKLNEIIFAFQGYVYPDQIKIFANLTFDNFIPWIFDGNGRGYGKVISDFSEASEAVWNSHVKDVLNKYSDYSITFTGHSLGGSIAPLIALKTKLFGFNQSIKVYTFGEPRAGDFEWAKTFQAKIPQAYRVVHSSDLLPHMPVCQRLFSGTCNNNLGYPYHQPQEIWYNDYLMSDGKYKICDILNGEDPNCSNSIPETQFNKNLIEWQGFDMQMRYYGQRLYDYGNAGCEDLLDNHSKLVYFVIVVLSKV